VVDFKTSGVDFTPFVVQLQPTFQNYHNFRRDLPRRSKFYNEWGDFHHGPRRSYQVLSQKTGALCGLLIFHHASCHKLNLNNKNNIYARFNFQKSKNLLHRSSVIRGDLDLFSTRNPILSLEKTASFLPMFHSKYFDL
jgi:hypothetical protein